ALLEKTFPKLKGLLPPIYAGSNLDKENIAGLINLFSKDVFRSESGGVDMLGRVYEYFIGEFANSEGKRGGEYFTPLSIVRTLVAMLEPIEGKVFDPCCGSGGMFVQSDVFAHHSGKLSFFGQESKEFTFRLCRLNLFIHGIDGDVRPGNSYTNDQHAELKADYVLANPPFNDGAKGENGWGARFISDKDARLRLPGDTKPLPLAPRNGNTMWMLSFLAHRKNEMLFIDGRKLGTLIPGSRKQKQLSTDEIERMAAVYRQFKHDRPPAPVPGFCAVANIDNVREYNYALTPGRYVGASDDGSEDEPFEERFPKLTHQLNEELVTSRTLADEIAVTMEQFSNGA